MLLFVGIDRPHQLHSARSDGVLAISKPAQMFTVLPHGGCFAPPLHEVQRILAMLVCFSLKRGNSAHFAALKQRGGYIRIEKSDAKPMG